MLKGLVYIHTQGHYHGRLTTDSIYINTNNGEIKLGEIAIICIQKYSRRKIIYIYIYIISTDGGAHSKEETKEGPEDILELQKSDLKAFGICVLEMLTTGIPLKNLCTKSEILHSMTTSGKGTNKSQLSDYILDEDLKDFIIQCLEANLTAPQLLAHKFLTKHSGNDKLIQKKQKSSVSSEITRINTEENFIRGKSNINMGNTKKRTGGKKGKKGETIHHKLKKRDISSEILDRTSSYPSSEKRGNQPEKRKKRKKSDKFVLLTEPPSSSTDRSPSHSMTPSEYYLKNVERSLPNKKQKPMTMQLPPREKKGYLKSWEVKNTLRERGKSIKSNMVNMKLIFNLGTHLKEIEFKYNLDVDSPEGVAEEMQKELGLSSEWTAQIKQEIQSAIVPWGNNSPKSPLQRPSQLELKLKIDSKRKLTPCFSGPQIPPETLRSPPKSQFADLADTPRALFRKWQQRSQNLDGSDSFHLGEETIEGLGGYV